jgi:hypothetical protein
MDITFPDVYDGPALSICYRIAELLDFDQFNLKHNKSIRGPLSAAERRIIIRSVSLEDTFSMTDNGANQIAECVVRVPDQYKILSGNSSTCNQVFEAKRFQIGEYICTDYVTANVPISYFKDSTHDPESLSDASNSVPASIQAQDKVCHNNTNAFPKCSMEYATKSQQAKHTNTTTPFTRISRWSHARFRMAFAVSYPSTFFVIKFRVNSGLNQTNLIRPVVHSPGSYPFMSLALANIIFRDSVSLTTFSNDSLSSAEKKSAGRKTNPLINKLLLTFSTVSVTSLEKPYTDNCLSGYSRNKCMSKCILGAFVQNFHKLPFQTLNPLDDETTTLNKDMKLFSEDDFKNKSMSDASKQIEHECEVKCYHHDCRMDYTLSRVSTAVSPDQNLFTFYVGTPDEPNVSVISIPHITTNDYFLLVLSLIGFWVGLSAQDLNFLVPRIEKYIEKKRIAKKGKNREEKQSRTKMTLKDIQKQQAGSYCVQSRKLLSQMLEHETRAAINQVMDMMMIMEEKKT